MCGRVACSLSPDGICTTLLNNLQNKIKLNFKDANNLSNFQQSFNIAPSQYCCVLTNCGKEDNQYVYNLECMQWGLLPSWGSGPSSRITNARSDSLLTKNTFLNILKKGGRCVVLAEGYYEWQTNSDKSKVPYYFYFPQSSKIKNLENEAQKDTSDNKDKRILTMAGIYDEAKADDNAAGDKIRRFAVVTVDADPSVAFVHGRMPAILNGYEEINLWLNSSLMLYNKAVKDLIKPVSCLKMRRVSSLVNQSKSQGPELISPYTPTEIKMDKKMKSKSSSLMMSWLKSSSKSTANSTIIKEEINETQGDVLTNTKKPISPGGNDLDTNNVVISSKMSVKACGDQFMKTMGGEKVNDNLTDKDNSKIEAKRQKLG